MGTISEGTFNTALHKATNSHQVKKNKVDSKERYYSTIKQRTASEPEEIRSEIAEIEKCLTNPSYANSPKYLSVLIKNMSKMKQEIEVKTLLSHDDIIKEVYQNIIKKMDVILKTASCKLQTLPDSYTYASEIRSSVSQEYYGSEYSCGPQFGYTPSCIVGMNNHMSSNNLVFSYRCSQCNCWISNDEPHDCSPMHM